MRDFYEHLYFVLFDDSGRMRPNFTTCDSLEKDCSFFLSGLLNVLNNKIHPEAPTTIEQLTRHLLNNHQKVLNEYKNTHNDTVFHDKTHLKTLLLKTAPTKLL